MNRRPYHHGDLYAALLREGIVTASAGGAASLTLRDLAKRAGVSPAAVYRHFPSLDHLVAAVSQQARERLASSMIAARDAVPADGTGAIAWERLLATGRAYVRFAVDAPRLFETAFAPCPAAPSRPDDPAAWSVLVDALDELAATGALTPERRATAPMIAWSAVHGLGTIVASGVAPETLPVDDALEAVLGGVRRALEG
jgi:AcrR family transcriptional regulator